MTTDKPVVDSPAPQGSDAPGNTVPPQTKMRDCETPCGGFTETLNYGSGSDALTFPCPNTIDGPGEEDGPWAKGWADRIGNDPLFERVLAAEQRRQTVQAEAMVNLAVGVVAMKMTTHSIKYVRDTKGLPDKFRITITPQDITYFQNDYTVEQVQNKDGSFTILVTRK